MPIQNKKAESDAFSLNSARIVLPVLDKSLHPSGAWQPKRYTKRLVSSITECLGERDEVGA